MNKHIFLFLFVMALIVMITSCSPESADQGYPQAADQEGRPAYIVYQAADEQGSPAPEVVVLDASGKELRRIALPNDVGPLFPTSLGCHILYEDHSVTQKWFLVDITSGQVQEFDNLPGNPQAVSSDHVLFLSEDEVYILDVHASKVLGIPIELDPTSPVPAIVHQIGTNPDCFTVESGGLWLVPTHNLEWTRRLDTFHAPFLSDDWQFIFYAKTTGEGESRVIQVIKETIDGSAREVLLADSDIRRIEPVPGCNQMLIARRDGISIFSLDNRQEAKLISLAYRTIRFDTDGTKAVLQTGTLEDTKWVYLDLTKGKQRSVGKLDGYERVFGGSPLAGYRPVPSRWLFLDSYDFQTREARIASLDINTAQVRLHTTFEGVSRIDLVQQSQDGQVALFLVMLDNFLAQIWLLAADRDGAVLLTDLSMGNASLSPDGKWVVLSEKQGRDQPMIITLVATDRSSEQVVGHGLGAVWVRP